MAFCTKCGKELGPDGVCDCERTQAAAVGAGNDFQADGAAAPTAVPVQPVVNSAVPETPAKKKNTALLAAIAAAAVLLIIIVAVALGSGSYKTPLKELKALINKQSTDAMAYQELFASSMDIDYVKELSKIMKKNEDFVDTMEEAKDNLEGLYEDYDGLKVYFEVSKAEKLDDDELKDISKRFKSSYKDYFKDLIKTMEDLDKGDYEDLADTIDVSVGDAKKIVKKTISYMKSYEDVKVSKGYNVSLRWYAKLDGDEDKTQKIEDVTILKVNGKWYIYNPYQMMSEMSFDDLGGVGLYRLYNYVTSPFSQITGIFW